MVARRIDIEPGSEVAQFLQAAKDHPVIVELDGARFSLELEATGRGEDPVSAPVDVKRGTGIHEPDGGYDPDRFAAILHQVAGSISVEDGERMKAYISAARAAGSRSLDEE